MVEHTVARRVAPASRRSRVRARGEARGRVVRVGADEARCPRTPIVVAALSARESPRAREG